MNYYKNKTTNHTTLSNRDLVAERPEKYELSTRDDFKRQHEKNVIKFQIKSLKSQLAATDYQVMKYAEGWISEEDYAPIKAQRQSLRDQINALEAQLG